jgi:hypothetical protein
MRGNKFIEYIAVYHEGNLLVVHPINMLGIPYKSQVYSSKDFFDPFIFILHANSSNVQESLELDNIGLMSGPELNKLLQELIEINLLSELAMSAFYLDKKNNLDEQNRIRQNVNQDVLVMSLVQQLDKIGEITIAENLHISCRSSITSQTSLITYFNFLLELRSLGGIEAHVGPWSRHN